MDDEMMARIEEQETDDRESAELSKLIRQKAMTDGSYAIPWALLNVAAEVPGIELALDDLMATLRTNDE